MTHLISNVSLGTLGLLTLVAMSFGCSNDSGAGTTSADGGSGQSGNVGGGSSGGSSGTSTGPTVGRCPMFPSDNAWNLDVSALPVHANSDNFIESIGQDGTLHPDFGTVWDGAPIGIPYTVVDGIEQVDIVFTDFPEESDPGPYPLPSDAAIEGGTSSTGDRHTLVIDESDCKLYELYRAFPQSDGSWQAGSGAVWDLTSNEGRGPDVPLPEPGEQGYTSADAAGLAIFPGLARYDEIVERGELLHALRFTVDTSQAAWVWPATHYASSNTDANLPPMGLRLRLRSSYDCSSFSAEVQVLCLGLKRFGMIVADNGSSWYVSGAPDSRWNDENLNDFKTIPGSAFEVVDTSSLE